MFSVSQIKVWTANPQQFVEDEDDDTFSYSVRISAQDLLLVRTRSVFTRVRHNRENFRNLRHFSSVRLLLQSFRTRVPPH